MVGLVSAVSVDGLICIVITVYGTDARITAVSVGGVVDIVGAGVAVRFVVDEDDDAVDVVNIDVGAGVAVGFVVVEDGAVDVVIVDVVGVAVAVVFVVIEEDGAVDVVNVDVVGAGVAVGFVVVEDGAVDVVIVDVVGVAVAVVFVVIEEDGAVDVVTVDVVGAGVAVGFVVVEDGAVDVVIVDVVGVDVAVVFVVVEEEGAVDVVNVDVVGVGEAVVVATIDVFVMAGDEVGVIVGVNVISVVSSVGVLNTVDDIELDTFFVMLHTLSSFHQTPLIADHLLNPNSVRRGPQRQIGLRYQRHDHRRHLQLDHHHLLLHTQVL